MVAAKKGQEKSKEVLSFQGNAKGKVKGKIQTKEWKRQKAKVKAGGSKVFQPTKKKEDKTFAAWKTLAKSSIVGAGRPLLQQKTSSGI